MAQTPAVYVSDGETIDYTPNAAKTAGDVVVVGNVVGIFKSDVAANALGALSVKGVFDVPKDSSDVSAGDALYWDADGNPVGGTAGTGAFTKTAAGNNFAMIAIEAAGTGVGMVKAVLRSIDGTVPGNLAPVPTGTVAASNSAQNNGTPITTLGLTVVTGGNNTAAVVLPSTAPTGQVLWLTNFSGGNNTLAVFPPASGAINALGANNVYTQATNSTIGFVRYNSTQWYTF